MLQRVLAGLTTIEGVDQAMLIDNRGNLMACVGNEGNVPPTEAASNMVELALEACTALGTGQLYEIWCEGDSRMMIDMAGPYHYVTMCHLWSTFDRVGLAAMRLSLAFSRFAAIAFLQNW